MKTPVMHLNCHKDSSACKVANLNNAHLPHHLQLRGRITKKKPSSPGPDETESLRLIDFCIRLSDVFSGTQSKPESIYHKLVPSQQSGTIITQSILQGSMNQSARLDAAILRTPAERSRQDV